MAWAIMSFISPARVHRLRNSRKTRRHQVGSHSFAEACMFRTHTCVQAWTHNPGICCIFYDSCRAGRCASMNQHISISTFETNENIQHIFGLKLFVFQLSKIVWNLPCLETSGTVEMSRANSSPNESWILMDDDCLRTFCSNWR